MFQNIFSMSPLVWTGWIAALVALPILIHLINLLRHQKVPWAAMEFLLRSHKRNKNWIRFRQWLLLASRISILLLILFMLAQVGCQSDQLARWSGSGTTHHYVVIDDSFSMGELSQGVSAMDRAKETLVHIAARARGRSNQRFTIIRFSTTANDALQAESIDQKRIEDLYLNAVIVDGSFDARIEEIRADLHVSNLSVGPAQSLKLVSDLVDQRTDTANNIYVLSDFCNKDWNNAPAVEETIDRLANENARIELIDCSQDSSQNLAIVSLEPMGCVRVAGIPMMMKIEVHNFSDTPARNVQVDLSYVSFSNTDSESAYNQEATTNELPTLLIHEIGPGETETRQFSVFFDEINQHTIKAQLQDDALPADNHRWAVVQVSTGAPVLMIDDERKRHAAFLSLAISPQGMTGIQPDVRTRDFLRDQPLSVINRYDVIYLLDIDRLDESAIGKLKRFAEQGGGIIFFVGEKTNQNHFTQILHEEHGLFPVPLDRKIETDADSDLADLVPTQQSMLAAFAENSQTLLDQVQISQRYSVPKTWWADNGPGLNTIATFRGEDSQPVIVEKVIGRGRSMAVLSGAGSPWNNWYRNGTYPAAMLLIENHLAQGRYSVDQRIVGESIRMNIEDPSVDPMATILAPQDKANRIMWQQELKTDPVNPDQQLLDLIRAPGGTAAPGIYDVWLTQSTVEKLNRFAVNLDTQESDLSRTSDTDLSRQFASANTLLINWSEFQPETTRNVSTTLSKALLLVLLIILFAEQILAYRASYHPPKGTASSPKSSFQPAR